MGCYLNGIEINLEDQMDYTNILTRPDNPMLSNFSQGSIFSSSQTKFIVELPMLADENSTDTPTYNCSQNSLGFGFGQGEATNDVQVGLAVQDAHTNLGVGAKRSASIAGLVSNVEQMPQKRNKLILNINKSHTQSETINTPEIIEEMLNLDEVSTASQQHQSSSARDVLLTIYFFFCSLIQPTHQHRKLSTTSFVAQRRTPPRRLLWTSRHPTHHTVRAQSAHLSHTATQQPHKLQHQYHQHSLTPAHHNSVPQHPPAAVHPSVSEDVPPRTTPTVPIRR